MSIKRISVILVVVIVSNTVQSVPTFDVVTDTPKPMAPFSTASPVPSAYSALSHEMLDVLKNFQSSLPGASQKTSATGTVPNPPPSVNNEISVMHFPAVSTLGSINGTNSNLMVPGVIHQRPFSLNMQMAEPPSSLIQSHGHSANPFPVSVPPPIAETSLSSVPAPNQQSSIRPESSRSPNPAILKIDPVSLPHNFNQELIKLLNDLKMTTTSLQEPSAAPSKNQMLDNGSATSPAETNPFNPSLSPASSSSLQPLKAAQPMLGPNQTPLDYLLSSSSPIHQLNSMPGYSTPSTNTNTLPTVDRHQPLSSAKPRLNFEFIKYLLCLPRYRQALNDLIKAQTSIQT